MSQQESATIPPFLNKIMSTVLRSPLHGMVSKSIMLITFTGRKSGKTYTTPISYTRDGNLVTAFTHAKWSRNLVGGAPVSLRIKNKPLQGEADVVSDDKDAIATALNSHLSQVKMDAKYYQVNFDDKGAPNWEDVVRAADNCEMIRVKLAEN